VAVAVKLYQCLLAQYVAFPNDTAALCVELYCNNFGEWPLLLCGYALPGARLPSGSS
jgi:hypothetical protein